jgi:8-oxo-dGTP diphosphatase
MIRDFKIFENYMNEAKSSVIKGCVVVIENEIGEILILKRSSRSRLQGWCLPGGRLEKGESIKDAALREAEEETNISLKKGRIKFIGIGHSVKGFQVAIYYYKLLKTPKVRLSREHDDYAWTNEPEKFEMAGNTLNYIQKVKNIENMFESVQFEESKDVQILYDNIDDYKIIFLLNNNEIYCK